MKHKPINPFTALWSLSHHFLFIVIAGIIFPPLGIFYLVVLVVYCARRIIGVRRERQARLARMIQLQSVINQSPRVLLMQDALRHSDGNRQQIIHELRRMRTYG